MWLRMRKKLLYCAVFVTFSAVVLLSQATAMASPGPVPGPTLAPAPRYESSEIIGEGTIGTEQPDSSEQSVTSTPAPPEGVGPEESIKANDLSGMVPFMILFVAIVVVARLVIRRIHRNQE